MQKSQCPLQNAEVISFVKRFWRYTMGELHSHLDIKNCPKHNFLYSNMKDIFRQPTVLKKQSRKLSNKNTLVIKPGAACKGSIAIDQTASHLVFFYAVLTEKVMDMHCPKCAGIL